MDTNFIRERISLLLKEKNISEYQLSMELGKSKGYIQSITSGRALPSMQEFFNICDYFEITPYEFFNTEPNNQLKIISLTNKINLLSDNDISLLENIVTRLSKKD